MFLRIAGNDPNRLDVEKNFQKILADMGKYDDAQKRAQAAVALDIRYATKEEEVEVGRRQYSEVRRLLENFSRYWRDPKSIAWVSQIINSAQID